MPRLQKQLAALQDRDRLAALEAVLELGRQFGQPHVHAGIGIRKMESPFFECRAGLKLRLLFRDTPEALLLEAIGTHDEIQRMIRS